jgi:glycosyltransferase involved in cell wall biosynthesis
MGAPLVSVCMPASRSAEAIAAALGSVLAQTLTDLEVLIGDDGGAGEKVVEAAGDERLRYRRNLPPLGFTANHEALLDSARGPFVAFLHDDDRWDRGYLEAAVALLRACPKAGMAIVAYREGEGGPAPHPPGGCHREALPLLLDERYRLLPSATVIRREALESVRRPWPRLSCGDMVLYLDAAAAGWGVAAVAEPLVSYNRHPGQISADDTCFRRDLVRLFELCAFADPRAERIRRRRLARSRLSLARSDLRAGRLQEARESMRRARQADRRLRVKIEALLLGFLAGHPAALATATRAWYRVRGVPVTAAGDRR